MFYLTFTAELDGTIHCHRFMDPLKQVPAHAHFFNNPQIYKQGGMHPVLTADSFKEWTAAVADAGWTRNKATQMTPEQEAEMREKY